MVDPKDTTPLPVDESEATTVQINADVAKFTQQFEKIFAGSVSSAVVNSLSKELDLSFRNNLGGLKTVLGSGGKALVGIYSDFFSGIEQKLKQNVDQIRISEREGAFTVGTTSQQTLEILSNQQKELDKFTQGRAKTFAALGIDAKKALDDLRKVQNAFQDIPQSIVGANTETQKQLAIYTSLSLKIGRSQQDIGTVLSTIAADLPKAGVDSEKEILKRLKLVEDRAKQISKITNISFSEVFKQLTGSFADSIKSGNRDFDQALETATQTAQRVVATGVGRASKLDDVLPSLQQISELEGEIQRITGEGVNFDVLLTGTRQEREREIFSALQAALQSGKIDAEAIRAGGRAAEEQIQFIQQNLGDKIGIDKNSMRRLLQQLAQGGAIGKLLPGTPTIDPDKIAGGLVDSASKLTREEITQAPTGIAVENQLTSPGGQQMFGNMLGDLQGQTAGLVGGPQLSAQFNQIADAAGKITNETLRLSALSQQFGKGDVKGLVGYYLLGPETGGVNILQQLRDIDTTVGNIGDNILQDGPLAGKLKQLQSDPTFQQAQETTESFRNTVQVGLAAIPKAYNDLQTGLQQFNNLVDTLTPVIQKLGEGGAETLGGLVKAGGEATAAGKALANELAKAIVENFKRAYPDLGSLLG